MAEGNVEASYPPKSFSTKNGVDDGWKDVRGELDSPATHAFSITPSQELLPTVIRGLYIGTAGNVYCRVHGGNTTHSEANVFFYNVVAGTILPVRMDGVFTVNTDDASQATTSTYLVGLY